MNGARPRPIFSCIVVLALAIAIASCGAPEESISSLRAALVLDSTLHTHVSTFRMAVLRAHATTGAVTCADFPGNLRLGDGRVNLVAEVQQLPWNGSVNEAAFRPVRVPAAQPLVVIAEGLANDDRGVFTIGRGCADNQAFPDGSRPSVTIDVRATSGAPCTGASDCEQGITCNQGADFPQGYCGQTSCVADTDCPPATHCVADPATGGLCAQACTAKTDCRGSLDCVRRVGGNSACVQVCVFPLWNAVSGC